MSRVDLGSAAFAAFAALTVGSAGIVAFARSTVRAAVALLGSLVGVAGLYVLLAADFLAAMQLLVYAGGTLVLFLLAAILTTTPSRLVPTSDTQASRSPARRVGLVLFATLCIAGLKTNWPSAHPSGEVPSSARLGHALLGEYLLPFELASVALLVALVGALAVARRASKPPARSAPSP